MLLMLVFNYFIYIFASVYAHYVRNTYVYL